MTGLIDTFFNLQVMLQYLPKVLEGMGVTILLSLAVVASGLALGLALGVLRSLQIRVLNALIEEDYVVQAPGSADRRQRLLTLTPKGAALERRLFKRQRDRLAPALTTAEPASAAAFRTVMRAIMDDSARAYLDAAHPAAGRQGTDADGR